MLVLLFIFLPVFHVNAQTSAFTYQGKLTDSAMPQNSAYLFEFKLYDQAAGGAPIETLSDLPATVTNGVFTVKLNFTAPNAFDGGERYLEISVKRNAGDSYTLLTPRQRIASAPYATRAAKAGLADSATNADNATNATNATNAATATNFSGNLAGDVSGTQTATVVDSVGGQTAANVASGAQLANAATSNNTANAIVRRDASGNFSFGTINGSKVNLNASDAQLRIQTGSGGSTGGDGATSLFIEGGTPLLEAFRLRNDGGFVGRGLYGLSVCPPIPATGDGTRIMFYPCKAAFRAGHVSGTQWDNSSVGDFSWAGGDDTIASGFGSFAFGQSTTVSATLAAGFGSGNTVSGAVGFAAGASNRCSGFACVAIGFSNVGGGQGSVGIGYRAYAGTDYAVSIGYRATNCSNASSGTLDCSGGTQYIGAVVIGATDLASTTAVNAQRDGEFRLRAPGGIRLRTSNAANANAGVSGNTGCDLPSGSGAFSCSSSRTIKENFFKVSGEDILKRIRRLPMTTWNYIGEGASARHIGPVAEDFYSVFKFGTSDKSIPVQDLAGVSLVGVQALEERTTKLQEENTRLRQQVEAQQQQLLALAERLNRLEQAKKTKSRKGKRK